METEAEDVSPMGKAGAQTPSREEYVLRNLLERAAAAHPDKTFMRFADGRSYTYAETLMLVRRTAAALQRLGVRQGDHVASLLPNDLDALRLFLATNYIGAVFVPMNTAYKGSVLQHVLDLSDARLLVLHADLAPRLSELGLSIGTAVILGGDAAMPSGIRCLGSEALLSDSAEVAPLARPIEPWDTLCITFTSGTTGPAKAVMSSYAQYHALGSRAASRFIQADDRYLLSTPLFHISSTARVYAMLLAGGSVAVVGAFRTDGFWDLVRETRSTTVTLMGAMATFLLHQPPGPDDRSHGCRTVAMLPMIDNARAFADRFAVGVYTFYNMTETSRPIVSDLNPENLASCGTVRPGVEVRIVDDNDIEVPEGEIGELVVRTDAPWTMSHGYYRDPENTAKAWRNGWFHTGDSFRRDQHGNYYFVDRLRDTIRRRGENISSFQVESEVAAHPAIREVAAYPVPSEHGESEVMIAVSAKAGEHITASDLIHFLIPRMPYFMVPRFVRMMDDLPKTPTQKIEKHLLRRSGLTEDTFDREKAGIRLKRERIGAQ